MEGLTRWAPDTIARATLGNALPQKGPARWHRLDLCVTIPTRRCVACGGSAPTLRPSASFPKALALCPLLVALPWSEGLWKAAPHGHDLRPSRNFRNGVETPHVVGRGSRRQRDKSDVRRLARTRRDQRTLRRIATGLPQMLRICNRSRSRAQAPLRRRPLATRALLARRSSAAWASLGRRNELHQNGHENGGTYHICAKREVEAREFGHSCSAIFVTMHAENVAFFCAGMPRLEWRDRGPSTRGPGR